MSFAIKTPMDAAREAIARASAKAKAASAPAPVVPPPEPSVGGERRSITIAPKPAATPAAASPAAAAPAAAASPKATAAPSGPDYAGIASDIKEGYNSQRQKAATTEAGNLQGQRDALTRRAAALGGGPGGAFIKAEQHAGDESAQRAQQANADIDAAQAAELRGVKMTQLGQQFATSEREGSQAFTAGQTDKGFAHEDTAQERGIKAQTVLTQMGINAQSSLQDRQVAAQKAMQATGISSQEAMQKAGITAQTLRDDFAAAQTDKDRAVKIDQFLTTMGFEHEKFDQEKTVDAFNMKLARDMFEKKDFLEKALGPLSPSGGQGPLGGLPELFGKFY